MALRLNIPPVTRALLILTVALSFLYNVARWREMQSAPDNNQHPSTPVVPYLTLVPAVSIFYPWTFLTSTFVEQNVITLLVNGATMLFGGRYLERAWGSKGFGMVVLIVAIIPNLLAVPLGITIQATFLVAFKQLVPEHTVSVFKGFVKMRVKHFPAVFLLLNTVSGIVIGTDTALVLAWLGFLTSWVYLRFYKHQPDLSGSSTGGQGLKGDASETFAFATFFPDMVQPPIAAVCDQIYIVLCNLKVCTPFSDEAIATGNEQAIARGEAGLPNLLNQGRSTRGTGKREEAERRRALALKALDQRLHASSARAESTPMMLTPTIPQGQQALGQTDYKPDEAQ